MADSYIEDVLADYGRLITMAADEYMAPNWTLDLVSRPPSNEWLIEMAERWFAWDLGPQNFVDEIYKVAQGFKQIEGEEV